MSEPADLEQISRPPASRPEAASGQEASPARRAFLRTTGLSALGAMIGMTIPFERNLPAGLIPIALAQDTGQELMSGNEGLTLLNDRPLNVETSASAGRRRDPL